MLLSIQKTNNWKLYASLLEKQHNVNPTCPCLFSHGYKLDKTGITPIHTSEWLIIKKDHFQRNLQIARTLLSSRGMLLPQHIVLVHAPTYIESGCPHTYCDKSNETAFIVFPGDADVDLKVMTHECIHVHQKYVGKTQELYLNIKRVNELMKLDLQTLRLNPDANPIRYAEGANGNMLCTKDDEKDVYLEERAYSVSKELCYAYYSYLLKLGTLRF
tara:strand:+ start:1508 stop:2155 length:648 start_codon:yes stop_codon:yes gene_type:complete